jgi:hypothetical protein
MNTRLYTRISQSLRRLGPYLLIELLLPGGTLLALLLWLSQGMTRGGFAGVHPPVVGPCAIERSIASSAAQPDKPEKPTRVVYPHP